MFPHQKQIIVGVSGVSGTGKTTLIRNLEEHFPNSRVITYTTRLPRPGESSQDYHFCTREEISQLPDTLWVKENYGNLYAVTRSSFFHTLRTSPVAILPTITSHHPTLMNTLTEVTYIGIHLVSSSSEELAKRISLRGDVATNIEQRLSDIARIDAKARTFDYVHSLPPASPPLLLGAVLAILESKH